MAYVPGDRVKTDDYWNLIGQQASNVPFASEAAAAQKLSGIYGVGYGQYGYMQIVTRPLGRPAEGRVRAVDWQQLRAAFEDCVRHQGLSTSGLPTADFFDVGDFVVAHDGHGTVGDFAAFLPLIDNAANRLSDPRTQPGSYDLVGPLLVDVRTFPTSPDDPLSSHPIFTWASGDLARAFFNAGGELVLRVTHPAGTESTDDEFRNFLAGVGDLRYGRDYWTKTGTGSLPVDLMEGYWQLDSANRQLVSKWNTDSFWPNIIFRHVRSGPANVSGNGDNGASFELMVACKDRVSARPPGVTGTWDAGTTLEVYVHSPKYLPDSLIPAVTINNTFDL